MTVTPFVVTCASRRSPATVPAGLATVMAVVAVVLTTWVVAPAVTPGMDAAVTLKLVAVMALKPALVCGMSWAHASAAQANAATTPEDLRTTTSDPSFSHRPRGPAPRVSSG